MAEPVDRSWVIALPKAEVHLHLEGCIAPALVTAASDRHGVAAPAGGPVTSLAQLLTALDRSCSVIDRADELTAIARGTALRAATSGVGHVDVIVNPTHWPPWHHRLDAMIDALDRGFRSAEDEGGASAVLCLSLKRTQTGSEALAFVHALLDLHHPRVAALSIDGDESDGSHSARFARAFAVAADGGLRLCAHAGESSGPDGVRQALDLLGVERIEHGVHAVEDPALVTELARRRVPLGVCLTSNVVLGLYPDLSGHPVETLRRQGVRVSLNTDDPLIYDVDVAGEYALGASTFGWGRPEVTALARTSIEACFAEDTRRRQLLDELDAFVASDHA